MISSVAFNEKMDFDFWWAQNGEWVELPNERRGGSSGVIRLRYQSETYYIKRQIGHTFRSFSHPLGQPTVQREVLALQSMARLGLSVPEIVFWGTKQPKGKQWHGLLVTKELTGFIDSHQWHLQNSEDTPFSSSLRNTVMRNIGTALALMHLNRWQHGCLYSKHIFINTSTASPCIALLDFEKSRKRLTSAQAARHDLSQLKRHAPFTKGDWQQLLLSYLNIIPVNPKSLPSL